MGLLASRVGFAVIVAGNIVFCLRLIGLEESNLQEEHGESYIEFCRRVPRLMALAATAPARQRPKASLGTSLRR